MLTLSKSEQNLILGMKLLEHKKVDDHSLQGQSAQAGLLINDSDSVFEVSDFQAWIIFTGLLFSETRSHLVQIKQVLDGRSGIC